MTSATISVSPTVRRRTAALAAAGVACAAIVIFAGNYRVAKGEDGGPGEALFTAIVCATLAVVLFGLVVPRVRNGERAGVVLGVLTVLSIVVFWSGVTPILGAAACAAAPRETPPSGLATAIRCVSGVLTLLVVVWTLANSHLF